MRTDDEILQEIKPGAWVVITEGEMHLRDHESFIFKTKKEAVQELRSTFLDYRKHPTVRKTLPGSYEYDIPDIDCHSVRRYFHIVQVTAENIGRIKDLATCTLNADDE